MKAALILALGMLGSQQGRVLCGTLWDRYALESMEDYEDLKSLAKELGWTVEWSSWGLKVSNGTDTFITEQGGPVEHWTIVK